jgi:hypothetical protein
MSLNVYRGKTYFKSKLYKNEKRILLSMYFVHFPRFSKYITEQKYYKYIDLYRLKLITLGEILQIFSEVAAKDLTKVVSVCLWPSVRV